MKTIILLAATLLSVSAFAAPDCSFSKKNVIATFGDIELSQRIIDNLANKGFIAEEDLEADPSSLYLFSNLKIEKVKKGLLKEVHVSVDFSSLASKTNVSQGQGAMFYSNINLDEVIEGTVDGVFECRLL